MRGELNPFSCFDCYTNIGWVVNDEVAVVGITLEYHRSNDGGSYAKILLLI